MNYNDYWTDTKHSKHETTLESIFYLVLGLRIKQKVNGYSLHMFLGLDTMPERIYNSHYSNGVPAMFTS